MCSVLSPPPSTPGRSDLGLIWISQTHVQFLPHHLLPGKLPQVSSRKKSQEIPFLPHITRWDRTHYVLVGPDCSWPLSCAVQEKPGGLCTPPSPNTAHLFGNCIFQRAALEHFQPWVSQDGLPVLSYCSCAASAPWVPWLIVGLAQPGFSSPCKPAVTAGHKVFTHLSHAAPPTKRGKYYFCPSKCITCPFLGISVSLGLHLQHK